MEAKSNSLNWEPNSSDALTWVNDSELSDLMKRGLLQFIKRFPNLKFYQDDPSFFQYIEMENNIILPKWLRQIHQTITCIMSDYCVWIQFENFNGWSPRLDRLNEIWYTLNFQCYSDDEEREFLEDVPDICLLPIGGVQETGESVLAINLSNSADQAVYEYNLEDLWDNADDGIPVSGSIRKVFDLYTDMFANISAIKIQYGDETQVINRIT